MIERFELSDGEKVSPAWLKIERFLEQRLAILRALLESDLDAEKTVRTRGQIIEVKLMLGLTAKRPFVEE